VATSYTKHTPLICHDRSAELRYIETIIKGYFIRILSIYVPKVYGLRTPLEVVNIFMAAVALFKNKSVLEQLTELFDDINFTVISNTAVQLAELSNFKY